MIPGQETRILHAMQYSQKKKKWLLMNLENTLSTLSKRSQLDKDYVLHESIYIKCPEKVNLKRKISGFLELGSGSGEMDVRETGKVPAKMGIGFLVGVGCVKML